MEANLKPLTPKEQQLLRRIREYIALNGHAPTLDELAAAARTTKVTVYEKVASLERKGYLRKDKHKSRAITILHDNPMEELRRVKKELRQVREQMLALRAAILEMTNAFGGPLSLKAHIQMALCDREPGISTDEIIATAERLTAVLTSIEPQPKGDS